MTARLCSACGKPESSLARGDFCEYCAAPMAVPPPVYETRKCYGCNAPFEALEGSTDRLCATCSARAAEQPSAPATLPDDDAQTGPLGQFALGLLSGPLLGAGIWLLRGLWQVSPSFVAGGFVVLVVLGKLVAPFHRRQRWSANDVFFFFGMTLSLVVLTLLT